MSYKNAWLIVEKKGTAQYKLNIQNVMKGEGGQWTDVAWAGAASFMVLSISQNLEVEFPPGFF